MLIIIRSTFTVDTINIARIKTSIICYLVDKEFPVFYDSLPSSTLLAKHMFAEHPKRKTALLLTLAGFYMTSSVAMAIALFIIGSFCYLSLVFETMRQLPPLPVATPKSPTPCRILTFRPGDNPELVIQQYTQKPQNSQQTSEIISVTPNSSHRVKM